MTYLIIASVLFSLYLIVLRSRGALHTFTSVGGIWLFASYFFGYAGFKYFEFVMEWDESLYLNDASGLWFISIITYLTVVMVSTFSSKRTLGERAQCFSVEALLKLAPGIEGISIFTLVFTLGTFMIAGGVPILSGNIEIARSSFGDVGVLSYVILWNSFAFSLTALLASRVSTPSDKFRLLLLAMGHIACLLGYAMRNYLALALVLYYCFHLRLHNRPMNFIPLIRYLPAAIVFLVTMAMIRSGRSLGDPATYLSLGGMLSIGSPAYIFLTSVFSEFRQWPALLANSIQNHQDLKYLLVPIFSLIPSPIFSLMGLSKTDYAFSSGLMLRRLLGLEWEGDNLGLRVSMLADFYLGLGIVGLVLFAICFAALLAYADRQYRAGRHLLATLFAIALAWIVIVGFISDLGTVFLKCFFTAAFFVSLLMVNYVLVQLSRSVEHR